MSGVTEFERCHREECVMGRLDGKVALISGGARGQGACEAHMFCREGAKVVLGDILDAEGKVTAGDIRAAGGEATYVHLNVTSETDVTGSELVIDGGTTAE
jgi:NAD(P)-dependent dehydrogenase (short-subunit alcohol dehydrogenase family)